MCVYSTNRTINAFYFRLFARMDAHGAICAILRARF